MATQVSIHYYSLSTGVTLILGIRLVYSNDNFLGCIIPPTGIFFFNFNKCDIGILNYTSTFLGYHWIQHSSLKVQLVLS